MLDFSPSRFSRKIIISTFLIIVSGVLSTLLFKNQTISFGLPEMFISIQVVFIFIGQYLNLIIFYVKIMLFRSDKMAHFQKYKKRSIMSGRMYYFKPMNIGIASLVNCFASLLQMYSLFHLSASLFQMMLGFGVLFTPFFSKFILRRKIYPHTKFGIFISALGLVIILFSSYYFDKSIVKDESIRWMVMLSMIVGVFLSSFQRVYEEWLCDKIETSSYRIIGYEGFYGIIFMFIFHIIFFFVDRYFDFQLFNIGLAVMKVARNSSLLISSVLLIISSMIFDITGTILTKKVNATYRVGNEIARVTIVWLIQIFFIDFENQSLLDKNYAYLTIFKILGYCLLILGNILINEIIEVKYFGLNRHFGRYQNSKFEDEMFDESEEFSIMKS
jgi:drug/metabolite transporter (DMT)-like permease